jgi:hypothetical protein
LAIRFAFQGKAGLSLAASVEDLSRPPSARKFWDGGKGAWSDDPAATVAAAPHPAYPDLYEVAIPDAQARNWPEAQFRVIPVAPAGDKGDRVVSQPFDIVIMGGSNTSLLPTADIGFLGAKYRIYGVQVIPNGPAPAPVATTPPAAQPAPVPAPASPSDPDTTPVANAATGKPATS